MSWTRVAGIGSAVFLGAAAVAGMRLWSVDLQQAFAGAVLEVRQATGLEVAMTGGLLLDLSWPPRALGDNLTIANPAWRSQPPLATAQRVEAELDPLSLLAGEVHVRRIVFKGVDLRVERNQDGRTNWTVEPIGERRALPAEWTDVTSSLTDFGIDRGRLAFIDHATRRELAIGIDRLITHAEDDDQPVEIEADARINKASVALAGTLGSVRQIKSGLPFAIDLTAAGAGATIAVNGQIAWPADDRTSAVALAATIEGADLRDLGPLIGAPLPSVGPYDLSTRIGTDAAGYRLSALKLRLGNSDIAGEVFVSLQEAKRRLVATLTSTLVDLADLKPAAAGDTTAPVFDAGRMPPEESSGFGMPAITDAQIEFTGARVVGGAFELDRVTADMILRDEPLTVAPFDARGDTTTSHLMDGMGGT
ncbi:MAG: AsmA family protein, partial [Dongiaceae bacterium]